MARTELGAGMSERYYRRTRLLSMALALLLRALWVALPLSRAVVPAQIVNRWVVAAGELIEEYHNASLAMANEYFVNFVAVEQPHVVLRPRGQFTGRWASTDVELDEDIDTLAKVMLNGRVVQIPDAANKVVESTSEIAEYDTLDLDLVAEVMGDDWAEWESEEPDDTPLLIPDPSPLEESNVRNRMMHKGLKQYSDQAQKIDMLTRVVGDDAPGALEETKKIRKAKKADSAWVTSTNAAVTLGDAGQDFVRAAAAAHGMGYVRVLGPNPCPFCVMLAAQGIIYEKGAWNKSNSRFRALSGGDIYGGGAKVHDGCQCRLEPVGPLDSPDIVMPTSVRRAKHLWEKATGRFDDMSWLDKMNLFRRVYKDGELDTETIDKLERDRLATERQELRETIPNLMMHLAHLDVIEEETGQDRSWQKDWYRGQLEYRLEKWKAKGYGDTNWEREYQWTIEKAASTFDGPDLPTVLREYDQEIRRADDEEIAESLQDSKHFVEWVTAQAPDAWKNFADYWPSYVGPVVSDDIMLASPAMPEFD